MTIVMATGRERSRWKVFRDAVVYCQQCVNPFGFYTAFGGVSRKAWLVGENLGRSIQP